jgi:hypothetical protein
MDNLLIIALMVGAVLIAVAVIVFVKRKHRASDKLTSDFVSNEFSLTEAESRLIEIPITRLPATTVLNETSLHEITDSTAISRISALVPTVTQTATRSAATAAQNVLKGTELVKLDIPFEKLTKSKDVLGAARGYVHGGKGVAAQANLIPVDLTKAAKATALANGVANVMNVGSLVVGQYYMSEISSKLETMSESISKISDFQDREFKGRIISLIARTEKYSGVSSEIIENDELRLRVLDSLVSLEGDATELLGQVNIEIADISRKCQSPTYQEYQTKIDDFGILVEYQNVLLSVLEKISQLTYLLGKGGTSSEMCYKLFNSYLEQSVGARNELQQWHSTQVDALKIDLEKNRKTKNWFEALPGIINDDWKYKALEQGMVEKISGQSQTKPLVISKSKDVFDEDVEIIIRDGKYYYLHESESPVEVLEDER